MLAALATSITTTCIEECELQVKTGVVFNRCAEETATTSVSPMQ